MKIILFIAIWISGVCFGIALSAWALYDPIPIKPAKYHFTKSAGAVPPYTMDGTKKLFRIECISESEKDCPQAVSIPEPGTLSLLGMGFIVLILNKKR